MQLFDLEAACAFGLEAVVKRELIELGFDPHVSQSGRVAFSGDLRAIAKCNLWLRTADRILVVVQKFPAADFDALFETIKNIDWHQYLRIDANFPVTARTKGSRLTSLPAIQRSAKKAIVESLRKGAQYQLTETGPLYKIDVALHNDQATLTIDTTGPSLHKRGYRKLAARAPIKETLAASLVLLSFWNPQRPLLDPFCGSGTIPIEAAMIGLSIAPGLQRDFAAQNWSTVHGQIFSEERAIALAASQQTRNELSATADARHIVGLDIDAEVLSLARYHAKCAGVEQWIHWQQRPFAELRSKREFGCLITNPPYGERLDDQRNWISLYQSIPQVLSRLPTWSHYLITNFPKFEQVIQKKADRRRKLYNGRIECTYYQFHGPHPNTGTVSTSSYAADNEPHDTQHGDVVDPMTMTQELAEHGTQRPNQKAIDLDPLSPEPVHVSMSANGRTESNEELTTDRLTKSPHRVSTHPVFGALPDKASEQANLFAARLSKRARHFRRWPTQRGIGCFRLYDRDIPEIPLVVDRYQDFLHITEYERPSDRDLGQQASWLELMAKTAAKALNIDRKNVFVKSRQRQRGNIQYEKIGNSQHQVIVNEANLKFYVNLADFVDTGLFLDHRITRSMVRAAAGNKRFLNLFAYTGSFSVYAAAGNASSTTTVDWSNTYLNWAKENMKLNGFIGSEHQFVREDATTFVNSLPKIPLFDLAVIDPPTFSNSKRIEDGVWDTQRCHAAMIISVAERMPTGSTIYFSTNYRRFKLDEESLRSLQIRDISRQTVPEDFRNKRIHRCWRIIT
ncbi:MAG TPA: bifunctional 23S rRNA (guanine(2069)-N(7))-methyltransferase RlmK/23S rRNA (guanine(2445)-N(2))-methyltransferase RlmL [Pirellulaceae bacterium]|nr:bifunctional 23S rRNA (guanine(2069)-N(7))-methyltransferase RlmK/23S rRNA (guanine(2445)-N(2))-methyltransferase RlmL [Pirellulaceae bacterium]HMO90632.1 bifunctional 23S rRNA (guanine(2069)-N(7))-methyltransferase RlmK/23S rRNA (guanine(2445)-N(2))-methyltransferase RlmL [Pirellulaceae bacterium]HMP67789.1 bifunctional 23S rRNA (guanine(2069)-N(7))-methyltransferase RlmK/23S rRNA (guanine(2445)-N(2))-methyltransferase RlmL [Pirellulaceae bacterium]